MKTITTERSQHRLVATINRPDALNAVNFTVMKDLEVLLDTIEEEQEIRCVILTGAGDEAFMSGGDLKEFHGITTAPEAAKMASRMKHILSRIEQLPCWTMAALNGSAWGGGWETMLAFDFIIAADEVAIHFTQGKFYLPPGWGGLTRLVERVGRSTALRWLAEAATVDADAALQHKLINRTVPGDELMEASARWADKLSFNDRNFIKALKSGTRALREARRHSIEEELDPFTRLWVDERHRERVERFLGRKE